MKRRCRSLRPSSLVTLLSGLSLVCLGGMPGLAVEFAVPEYIDVGNHPLSVATGDFDGDGRLDMAVGVTEANGDKLVSIHLGRGLGRFDEPISIPVPFSPTRLRAAHLDQDGMIDLMLTTAQFSTLANVAVLINQGGGNFGLFGPFGTDRQTVGVAAGDFDEDGLVDLAVANQGNFTYSVLLNDGINDFSNSRTFATGLNPTDIVTADFNEDGNLDLAISLNGESQINIHFGDGAGNFDLFPQEHPVGLFPDDLTVADLNEDQHLDLIVAIGGIQEQRPISVLLGDGLGGFSAPVDYMAGVRPRTVAVTDLNADGHQDVIVGLEHGFSLFHGDGQGGLTLFQTDHFEAFLSGTSFGDIDEDDRIDLVVSTTAPFHDIRGSILVYHGNESGGFDAPPRVDVGGGPRGVHAADFNEDGRNDFVVSTTFERTFSVYLGAGDGTFTSPIVTGYPVEELRENLEVGDVNQDNHLDIVFVDVGLHQAIVVLGDGTGNFGAPTGFPVSNRPHDLCLVDLNGDQKLDLITAHDSANTANVLIGDGAGNFGPPLLLPVGSTAWNVAAGDFNEDQRVDIVISDSFGDALTIYLSDGTGQYHATSESPMATSDFPTKTLPVDFDEDGHLDLVVLAKVGALGEVRIHRGLGDGTFQTGTPLVIGVDPSDGHLADFDEDGNLDLAVAHLQGDFTTILTGDGMGGFRDSVTYGIDDLPAAHDLGDFNGDGHTDIITTDGRNQEALVLLNTTFDPVRVLRGNVNAGAGGVADVLTVNGGIGNRQTRVLDILASDPLTIEVLAPPQNSTAPFVIYAWLGSSDETTAVQLPLSVGAMAMAPPFLGGSPRKTANNLGHVARLGVEDWPGTATQPAPTTLLSVPFSARGTFTVQGLIADSGSASGQVSVTNGLVVVSQ